MLLDTFDICQVIESGKLLTKIAMLSTELINFMKIKARFRRKHVKLRSSFLSSDLSRYHASCVTDVDVYD
jgi:hypothetical protein